MSSSVLSSGRSRPSDKLGGGGGGHIDPEIRLGCGLKKTFFLDPPLLSNQANVLKHMFDQTWRIVYTFRDISHLFYPFPRCKRLTNVRF